MQERSARLPAAGRHSLAKRRDGADPGLQALAEGDIHLVVHAFGGAVPVIRLRQFGELGAPSVGHVELFDAELKDASTDASLVILVLDPGPYLAADDGVVLAIRILLTQGSQVQPGIDGEQAASAVLFLDRKSVV